MLTLRFLAVVAVGVASTGAVVVAEAEPIPEIRIGVVTGFEGVAAAQTEPGVRLVSIKPEGPWRGGAGAMARLVFEHRVVALIGAADASSAHAAAQIATRARIPFITTSPDQSLTAAHDPWIFQAAPSDRAQAEALLVWAQKRSDAKVADVVVPKGRDGRERLSAVLQALAANRVTPGTVTHYDLATGGVEKFVDADRLLLIWLDPEPALSYLENSGSIASGRTFGSSRLDDPRFLLRATAAADGLLLPALRTAEAARDIALTRALEQDIVAVVVAAAARVGSLDQTLIRDAIQSGKEFCGLTACFGFDQRGRRKGDLPIGVVRTGRLRPAGP